MGLFAAHKNVVQLSEVLLPMVALFILIFVCLIVVTPKKEPSFTFLEITKSKGLYHTIEVNKLVKN